MVWLETKGVRIDWHGQKALIFFLMDVTKRKRAENALYVSEEKYRLMAENAQDVIWVLDLTTGCFTYMSPSVHSLRGVTADHGFERVVRTLEATYGSICEQPWTVRASCCRWTSASVMR